MMIDRFDSPKIRSMRIVMDTFGLLRQVEVIG